MTSRSSLHKSQNHWCHKETIFYLYTTKKNAVNLYSWLLPNIVEEVFSIIFAFTL